MVAKKAQSAAKVAAPEANEILRAHTVFGYVDVEGVEKRAYIGDVIRVTESEAAKLKAAHLAGGAVGMGKRTGNGKPVIVRADTDDQDPEFDDTDDDEIAMDGDHYFAPVAPVDADLSDDDE